MSTTDGTTHDQCTKHRHTRKHRSRQNCTQLQAGEMITVLACVRVCVAQHCRSSLSPASNPTSHRTAQPRVHYNTQHSVAEHILAPVRRSPAQHSLFKGNKKLRPLLRHDCRRTGGWKLGSPQHDLDTWHPCTGGLKRQGYLLQ